MKASRFADAQKAFILKLSNEESVSEICRQVEISHATSPGGNQDENDMAI